MSGFEIVGVVLGALPIVVKAVQVYLDIFSAHRTAKRDLTELIQDLQTEEACLRNTCELLISGVAPRSMVDKLVENPLGPEWNQFDKQLRLRLWMTHGEFKNQARKLLAATQELQEMLRVHQDGKVCGRGGLPFFPSAQAQGANGHAKPRLTDRIEILRELRRNSAFTLRKKDYDGVLNRIKSANSVLEKLAGQNRQLEPERKQRSQARLTRLLRELTRGLYEALRRAMTCRCTVAHNVCLELNSRSDVVLLPSDMDDTAAEIFDFHVVFGSHGASSAGLARSTRTTVTLSQWESVSIRVESNSSQGPPDPPLTPTTPNAASNPVKEIKGVWFRKLRWSETITSKSEKHVPVSTAQVGEQLTTPQQKRVPEPTTQLSISNLCHAVLEKNGGSGNGCQKIKCYGYIPDSDVNKRRFALYPRRQQQNHQEQQEAQQSNPPTCRVITLRQVLEGSQQNTTPFNYLEKLEIALAVAVSVLHLYGTPWLAHTVTLDDIVFLREGINGPITGPSVMNPNRPESTPPYRPFITKPLKREPGQTPVPGLESFNNPQHPWPPGSQNQSNTYVANLAILSLGALLIQVIIGKSVNALEMTGQLDADALLSKYTVGTGLLSQIRGSGGTNYEAAVNWCLENAFKVANLKNDKFCDEYYGEVVARLERDAQLLADD